MRSTVSFLAFGLAFVAFADKPVTITILHTNDMHAHVEPVTIAKKSYGGYARLATLIKQFRKSDPNPILLNAGDTFQGTMYFNVYEGLADLAFMNAVGFQAMTLGNHEFDRGPAILGSFLKYAKFPIVNANLDVSRSRDLRDIVKPSAIIGEGDAKVGVVGAITPDVTNISSPGPRISVIDMVSNLQHEVDALHREGIHKVILLTHIGYDEDKALAARMRDVAVIVGGHSHSPLGTPPLEGWPKPHGPYPTMVKDRQGKNVVIVQGWEWGKVLGRIKLHFNATGRVDQVLDAKPVVVDDTVTEDREIAGQIAAFKKPIEAAMNEEVGFAEAALARDDSKGMPAIIADAMLAVAAKQGAVVAFVNGGGVRGAIEPGKITYGIATSIQPFRNTLTLLDLTGDEIVKSLEIGYGTGGVLFPSAGFTYEVDRSKPKGSRVSNVKLEGAAIDPKRVYRVALPNFTAGGGDNQTVLKAAAGRRVDTGIVDIDTLVDYLKAHRPLKPATAARIIER